MQDVIERFLRYVKIDTQSSEEHTDQIPSTQKQFELARLLVKELQELGAADVRLDEEHCYVYASIPSNTKTKAPVIGLIAHMDTSPEVSGANVKPRIVEQYDGGKIVLNEQLGYRLKPSQFPSLLQYIGKDLIVTDGTTLLGADDKAGVAEIMSAAAYLLSHPEYPHGEVRIGFTPDEEIGNGVEAFQVESFGADYAYTVDGGALGELEYENFNASSAAVTIHGTSVHPGSAKGKMVNALLVGMELQSLLPAYENPAATEGYEGFYHVTGMEGGCDECRMSYIIRDHDAEKFEQKNQLFQNAAAFLNQKYGEGTVEVQLRESYRNMKEQLVPHMHLIETAKTVMEELSISPVISPIRGGTDGARLSYMGLPCPNLFTGGENYHGRYEYACVQSMEAAVSVILGILKAYSEKEG